MKKPVAALANIRIVDLSRVLAGPYATMLLADYGAEVIKIEQPGQGDGTRQWGPPWVGDESAYFLSVNRNKKSVTIISQREKRQVVTATPTPTSSLTRLSQLPTVIWRWLWAAMANFVSSVRR